MDNFYQKNVKYQIEKIKDLNDYQKLLNDDENFIVDCVPLSLEAQFLREKVRILNEFTFGKGEDFDFNKYNKFRSTIDDLSYAITDYQSYDTLAIKKIIVCLDLELGIDVQFNSSFYQMFTENELDENYEMIQNNYSFNYLYNKFEKGYTKGRLR